MIKSLMKRPGLQGVTESMEGDSEMQGIRGVFKNGITYLKYKRIVLFLDYHQQ